VFPEGDGRTPRVPALDLCTKTALRRRSAAATCYKTDSDRKLLIHNKFCSRAFFASNLQLLDFSGFAGDGRIPINKVIHNPAHALLNGFQINDLPQTSKNRLKNFLVFHTK
jgi:hypothetical protein